MKKSQMFSRHSASIGAVLRATDGVSEFDFDQTKDSEASCGGEESRLGAVGAKVAKLVVTNGRPQAPALFCLLQMLLSNIKI